VSWIKFDTSTPEKPEVLSITIALGWDDPDLTVGKLLKVWRWFDAHSVDGNAHNVTPALLDRIVGVTGITQAMVDAGWMHVLGTGLMLPKFENHNGKTAKDRALTAKRVANFKANGQGNDDSVSDALPREEKRREEGKLAKANSSSAKPPPCPHSQILELFGQHLPELPQPKPELWTGQRQRDLLARWKWLLTAKKKNGDRYAENTEQGLAWFARFFAYVAKSDFLSGRSGKWTACDLGWLLKQENFIKVTQGNYENKDELQ